MDTLATVYLGLGSNLGDRAAHLADAVAALGAIVALRRVSPVYETAPQLVTEQPKFLNVVCEGMTALSPTDLLGEIKGIERHLGRKPGPRYGPRVIDIDILLYDDLTLQTSTLTLPHPRIPERAFVLIPLRDLAPDLSHPSWNGTVATLAARLGDQGVRLLGSLYDVSPGRYNGPV